MPELLIDGRTVQVETGITVLSALQNAGQLKLRRSLSGEARGALCGMGLCFECRVLIDGVPLRSCQTPVREGQRIELPGGDHD